MMLLSKKLLIWFVICLFVTVFIYIVIGSSGNMVFDGIQISIIMISIFFSAASLTKPFSIMSVVFLFCFFFFGIIPLNDISNGNIYWGGDVIDIPTAIVTSLMILVCLLIFIFNVWVFGKRITRSHVSFSPTDFYRRNSSVEYSINNYLFFLIFVLACAYIFKSSNYNIFQVMVRGLIDPDLMSESSGLEIGNTAGLVYNNYIKPLPIIMLIFLVYCYRFKGCKVPRLHFIFYGFLVLIFNSPFSMPRFQVGSLYLALVLIYFNIFYRPFVFVGTFISALLLVFPFLDKFRNFDSETFDFALSLHFLNEGHFDSYNNFVLVVQNSIVTGGAQLLTVVLFFVPRSFWPEKAVGSGGFMADQVGLGFSNISMPLLAEGYINFGLIGVILFAFTGSFLFVKADNLFWHSLNPHFLRPIYFLFIGMVFFVMRGDLLSSYAYSIAMVFCYLSVYKLLFTAKRSSGIS
jgi:hypothetical protein